MPPKVTTPLRGAESGSHSEGAQPVIDNTAIMKMMMDLAESNRKLAESVEQIRSEQAAQAKGLRSSSAGAGATGDSKGSASGRATLGPMDWPAYLPSIASLDRMPDVSIQERVKMKGVLLTPHGGRWPSFKASPAEFADWSRDLLSLTSSLGLSFAFLTDDQLRLAGYQTGVDLIADSKLEDARDVLKEALIYALTGTAASPSDGLHLLTVENRVSAAKMWQAVHEMVKRSEVGEARPIRSAWDALTQETGESFNSFIVRINETARLRSLCMSVGPPNDYDYRETLQAGLCERLRARCNDIVQRTPNISYDALRVELAQEERSYFRNKPDEFARQRTVRFVSPLMSVTPAAAAQAQAKVQANVAVDGIEPAKKSVPIRGNCYGCGEGGHKEVDCPKKRPDKKENDKKSGKKGEGKKGDVKPDRPRPCYAFQNTGECSKEGCKFSHTRTPGGAGGAGNPSSHSIANAAISGQVAPAGAAPMATGIQGGTPAQHAELQRLLAAMGYSANAAVVPRTEVADDWFADANAAILVADSETDNIREDFPGLVDDKCLSNNDDVQGIQDREDWFCDRDLMRLPMGMMRNVSVCATAQNLARLLWLIDSGASRNFCKFRDDFISLDLSARPLKVGTSEACGLGFITEGKGTVRVFVKTHKGTVIPMDLEAWYAPNVSMNILSYYAARWAGIKVCLDDMPWLQYRGDKVNLVFDGERYVERGILPFLQCVEDPARLANPTVEQKISVRSTLPVLSPDLSGVAAVNVLIESHPGQMIAGLLEHKSGEISPCLSDSYLCTDVTVPVPAPILLGAAGGFEDGHCCATGPSSEDLRSLLDSAAPVRTQPSVDARPPTTTRELGVVDGGGVCNDGAMPGGALCRASSVSHFTVASRVPPAALPFIAGDLAELMAPGDMCEAGKRLPGRLAARRVGRAPCAWRMCGLAGLGEPSWGLGFAPGSGVIWSCGLPLPAGSCGEGVECYVREAVADDGDELDSLEVFARLRKGDKTFVSDSVAPAVHPFQEQGK